MVVFYTAETPARRVDPAGYRDLGVKFTIGREYLEATGAIINYDAQTLFPGLSRYRLRCRIDDDPNSEQGKVASRPRHGPGEDVRGRVRNDRTPICGVSHFTKHTIRLYTISGTGKVSKVGLLS